MQNPAVDPFAILLTRLLTEVPDTRAKYVTTASPADREEVSTPNLLIAEEAVALRAYVRTGRSRRGLSGRAAGALRKDEEQLSELEYRVAGLLEEPWDKGEGRPRELTLREVLLVTCGHMRQNIIEDAWADIFGVAQ